MGSQVFLHGDSYTLEDSLTDGLDEGKSRLFLALRLASFSGNWSIALVSSAAAHHIDVVVLYLRAQVLVVELHQESIYFLKSLHIKWVIGKVNSERFRNFIGDHRASV